jgi:hypothetical protein
MNNIEIEQKAENMRKQLGGTVFAFPIYEEDPFSGYAVVMWAGEKWHVYPRTENIHDAALGVKTIMEMMEQNGFPMNYQQDVRFVSYDAQINAPSLPMRRIKKEFSSQRGALQEGVDVTPTNDGYNISARGLVKFSYLEMVDEKNPKAALFMDEYYKLLAMRKYGKTAGAIKQEVRGMSKDEAIKWIERTYSRYIPDDSEIINIMNMLKGG